MKVGVVVFPGSNCDRDALHAAQLAGAEATLLWHEDADLHGSDLVVLPGGFAYGDYLRAGALARFSPIILPLAIVGSLSAKRRSAESSGTLSVEGGVFATMLAATIIVIGALTFFPAATLGPIAEHLMYMN